MYTAFVYPSGKLAKLTEAEFARQFPDLNRVIVPLIPEEEPPMLKLFYFNTDEIPAGVVTSTARLGDGWNKQVEVGDTVAVHRVGDKEFAHYAVVVAKEFLSYQDIWENAQHNSVGYGKPLPLAQQELNRTMQRACGEALRTVEMVAPHFTVLHLLPINNAEDIPCDIAEDILDSVVEGARGISAQAHATIDILKETCANQATALLTAQRRCSDVEKSNHLLVDIIAQKVAEQEEKDKEEIVKARGTISEIHAMAIGHEAALKNNGPYIRAVERTDVIGDLESTLRIEF